MKNVYFYPSCPPGGYTNPYCVNFKKVLSENFNLLDKENNPVHIAVFGLLKYCFKADVIVLNWIEKIYSHRGGLIQFILTIFCFIVIKLRNAKIIWVFHNIQPHEGRSKASRIIESFLERNADVIIAHSQMAADYVKKKAKCNVLYICHPFNTEIKSDTRCIQGKIYDILIWGSILPYKGIPEFLNYCSSSENELTIKIIGKCNDMYLNERINKYAHSITGIVYENRRPSFRELQDDIIKSRWVLFPYIGQSVSSSGALMDTLSMGGIPIGPNVGAFKDLQQSGVCLTYDSYDDMFDNIIKKKTTIQQDLISEFIKQNTWQGFAIKISEIIIQL